MITTHIVKSKIPQEDADALNRESARCYNRILVNHWRTYRKKDIWLPERLAYRWGDYADGGTILHAHSRDAAQQAFYRAIKRARALRKAGVEARFPHKVKRFRTTVWKNTGIRVREGKILLARARGLEPVVVPVPEHLADLDESCFKEIRLVWNRRARQYDLHIVVDDGLDPPPPPGEAVVAVDLGEIHPAAATDGAEAVVFSARELRALRQYRNKRLAQFQERMSTLKKGSRRYKRLKRRKRKFLAKMKRKQRDIEHKVSRAVVDWAVERKAGTIVIGDVRDVGEGKRLNRKGQQKISQWSHGQQRRYIEYKAERAGIKTALQDEAYTTQTCPCCGERQKPRGRVYRCRSCGFTGHRDVVGAVNIRAGYLGEQPEFPEATKYRRPFVVNGLRSSPGHGASSLAGSGQEATGF